LESDKEETKPPAKIISSDVLLCKLLNKLPVEKIRATLELAAQDNGLQMAWQGTKIVQTIKSPKPTNNVK